MARPDPTLDQILVTLASMQTQTLQGYAALFNALHALFSELYSDRAEDIKQLSQQMQSLISEGKFDEVSQLTEQHKDLRNGLFLYNALEFFRKTLEQSGLMPSEDSALKNRQKARIIEFPKKIES